MPRAKAILQAEYPYNISARCINRDWFNVPMEKVWEIFCDELDYATKEYNLVIHSFVLMSNHFHLIASTPDANISQCMQQFMFRVSRRLTRAGNRINETFAGRHFKTILQTHKYYLNAYKYNYRNPVDAGICEKAEDYEFSSLRMKLKLSPSKFPVCEDGTLYSDNEGTLRWLNTPSDPIKLEGYRWGIKRQYFKSKKHRNTNMPMLSDDDLL
ncbi:transposase [Bdellovibrio sp. GT3]|uniref:transposase n=1 Tax=Bdellovibrio sp. GT3 TaxID=3136282 RepID=UPI0030F176F2